MLPASTLPLIHRMTPQEFFIKYKSLTHADLANLLGVSLVTVDSWCSGARNCTEQVKRHIARIDEDFERFAAEKIRQDNSLAYSLWLDKVWESD